MGRMDRLRAGQWPGNHNDEPVASFGGFPKRKEKPSGGQVKAGNDEQVASSDGQRKNKTLVARRYSK